jgi:cysteine synthase A
MPSIVFVEANTTGSGVLALQTAAAIGLHPVLFAAEPARYSGLAQTPAEVVRCDTGSPDALQQAAGRVRDLLGVTTTSDYFLIPAAELAGALGLPGNPPEVVRLCRDKAAVRRRLGGTGGSAPKFAEVRRIGDLPAALVRVGVPCIVKPTQESGSWNVRLCRCAATAHEHARQILSATTNVRGQVNTGALVVEEYVDGCEYSVETFTLDGVAHCVGVTETTLTGYPWFVESAHRYPAPVSSSRRDAIADAVTDALAVLGVRHGPAHTEVRVRANGDVVPIEVNARLAGGMIPELVRLVDGVNLIEQQVRAAVGWPTALRSAPSGCAGIAFFMAPAHGRLTAVRNVDRVGSLPGVVQVTVTGQVGSVVQPPHSAYDRLGYVIACGPSADAVSDRLDAACRTIQVDVEPIPDRPLKRPGDHRPAPDEPPAAACRPARATESDATAN